MQGNEQPIAWPVDLSHMRPEDAAEWVVARYGDGYMPIRPERIAQRMGVGLYEINDGDLSAILIGKDGKLGIVIDLAASEHRLRFAVAHGLGHILLRHEHPPIEAWSSFGDDAPDPRDQAANRFAASLLVPAEDLRWCVGSGWMRNVAQIAKTLRVPESLLTYRYRQLIANR